MNGPCRRLDHGGPRIPKRAPKGSSRRGGTIATLLVDFTAYAADLARRAPGFQSNPPNGPQDPRGSHRDPKRRNELGKLKDCSLSKYLRCNPKKCSYEASCLGIPLGDTPGEIPPGDPPGGSPWGVPLGVQGNPQPGNHQSGASLADWM